MSMTEQTMIKADSYAHDRNQQLLEKEERELEALIKGEQVDEEAEDNQEPDSESAKDAEVSAEGDTEQEETEETIETPEGNEIEVAGIETDYAEPLLEETEEYLANDYGKNSNYGTMTKQKFAFIV